MSFSRQSRALSFSPALKSILAAFSQSCLFRKNFPVSDADTRARFASPINS